MSFPTGEIASAITKLRDLVVGEHNLAKGVKLDIMSIQSELQSMQAFLEGFSGTPADQLGFQNKIWASDLRELSYDIEDSIETFMVHRKEPHGNGSSTNLVDKCARLLKKYKISHRLATEIGKLKSRVRELQELRPKHEVNLDVRPSRVRVRPFRGVDPRLLSLYEPVEEMAGINETKDEVIDIFMPQSRIVSIVGMAGLGKTTLARAVYEDIGFRAQFDCSAFVSVSPTPNFTTLFRELLCHLHAKYTVQETWDERQLIHFLRNFLRDKRYFIVIDDIWDSSVWKIIKCALPNNNAGYRIIMTTRNFDIAARAGRPYKLKPLSLNNSRKLLYRRILLFSNVNGENNEETEMCPDKDLAEASDRILKKCAGVPLAIIVMASLLAHGARNKTKWFDVHDSFGTGLQCSPDVENMRKIFSFSYYDMPSHLRSCLLYLSVFPEGQLIEKDRLIRMWIAEGLTQDKKQGQSLFEVGESYFDELINRSMIQPIYDSIDMVHECRVHSMVLDLIRSLSSEENFVTILNGMDHRYPSNKIRRLSLQHCKEDHALISATRSLQQLRSVVAFPSAIGLMPILESFHVLRVMDLQDCDLSQVYSLKYLRNLFHLRYIGLRGTHIQQVPEGIENIQFLQTLDVRHNNITTLPSTVVQLGRLMFLYTDTSTKVPNGIGSLRNLEELSTLCIDNSTDIIEELGQLTELRVLKIVLLSEWNCKLVQCLCKLQNIQRLYIRAHRGQRRTGYMDVWVPPRHLRALDTQWSCWFSTLPACMNPSLVELSSLSIAVREVHQTDLEILGRLPALRYLELTVDHGRVGINDTLTVGSSLFPFLAHCRLFGFIVPVMFQQGAMPRLKSTVITFLVLKMKEIANGNGSFDLGLGNLPVIQDVTILLNSGGASEGDLEEAEAALRHATEFHPNRPTLQIFNVKRDVKSHVKEAHEKHERYNIDSVVAKPVTTTVFPCLFTRYMKAAEVVGIEEPVNEIMNILIEGNEVSTKQGKIVSIVGLGGLGKTTLARAIYAKLRAQFDCWAFVSVSQNPDMKKLFKCMLYKLGKKNYENIHEEILDERQVIYELNEFLDKKRYFIVIDDIWNISVWKMIRRALPANNGGYIIITTTRMIDVAKQVGGIYRMRPLCLENSRTLLRTRVFGVEDEDKYFDDELIKVSEKILQKCGGIPLAIIMISGLLASKGGNKIEWYKIHNAIDTKVKNNQGVDNIKTILSLSYDDLPSRLRTCFFYLSVFPEGYVIDKDRLIWLWIAEDLIQSGKGKESPFELGESYFYELITRNLIQPVYKRWQYDMTESSGVHDMILDLICDFSGKEMFVSIWNHMHHTFDSKEVQWLSLQNSMVDHAMHRATLDMQEVRSVVVFPSAVNLLPTLASFRVLRVLDLQSCRVSQGCSLKGLGNLVHLRYLGLRDTGVTHLSEEIENLRSLQTLDVAGNEISSLPSTVAELKHLICLHIDSWTKVPNGIGSFTSLEDLSTLRIQDSTDILEKLGNQTELRVLGIDCRTGWNASRVEKSLVECLHKLQKLRTLSISVVGECKLDGWVAPRHLRRLELTGCWPSMVPALLNPSLLPKLSFLSIEVRNLRQEDLEILGRLPALSYLDVDVDSQNLGILQRFVIGARSFPLLVQCMLRGYIGPVVFQHGAMPRLARLHLVLLVQEGSEFTDSEGVLELGLGNLPLLKDVTFLLRRGGAAKEAVEEAEAALRRAIEMHPNGPTLEIL